MPRVSHAARDGLFAIGHHGVVTSLMAEASSFMAFTQPQILLCGASPDAARRASPTLKGKPPVSNDKIRRHTAEVPIPPTAEAAGPFGTH